MRRLASLSLERRLRSVLYLLVSFVDVFQLITSGGMGYRIAGVDWMIQQDLRTR